MVRDVVSENIQGQSVVLSRCTDSRGRLVLGIAVDSGGLSAESCG